MEAVWLSRRKQVRPARRAELQQEEERGAQGSALFFTIYSSREPETVLSKGQWQGSPTPSRVRRLLGKACKKADVCTTQVKPSQGEGTGLRRQEAGHTQQTPLPGVTQDTLFPPAMGCDRMRGVRDQRSPLGTRPHPHRGFSFMRQALVWSFQSPCLGLLRARIPGVH